MEDAQFGVFLSKLTDITGKSDGMVVSVKVLAFNGIFRGRHLLVVFYGSHVLLMVHNQFSLECILRERTLEYSKISIFFGTTMVKSIVNRVITVLA